MRKQIIEEITRIKQMMNILNEEDTQVTYEQYKEAIQKLSVYTVLIASYDGVGDDDDIISRLDQIREIRRKIETGDEEMLNRIWKMVGDDEEYRHAVNVIWFYTHNNPDKMKDYPNI